jgi:protein phosphatase
MPLALRVGSRTLQGPYRADNEDALGVLEAPDRVVCVVADGMGGPGQGGRASQRAVAAILTALAEGPFSLREAFARAHEEVLTLHQGSARPASTVTVAFWPRGAEVLHLAHLGDTRAYRARGGKLEQFTVDHDIVAALAAQYGLSREEVWGQWRVRNVLVRFLGHEDASCAEPDLSTVSVRPGDRLLLCSDGLSSFVDDGELLGLLSARLDVRERADALAQLALDRRSRDNVSCIVGQFFEEEGP